MNPARIGSSFDSWLVEEGIYDSVQAQIRLEHDALRTLGFLLDEKRRRTRHAQARSGPDVAVCGPTDAQARCWCFLGALRLISEAFHLPVQKLAARVRSLGFIRGRKITAPSLWGPDADALSAWWDRATHRTQDRLLQRLRSLS